MNYRIGQCVRIREESRWHHNRPSPRGQEAIVIGHRPDDMDDHEYLLFAPNFEGGVRLVADGWELEPSNLSPDLAALSATELTV